MANGKWQMAGLRFPLPRNSRAMAKKIISREISAGFGISAGFAFWVFRGISAP